MSPPLTTIGWREYVDLPDWGIKRVRAKVDTGANTSSIDAFDIVEVEEGVIVFRVVRARRPKHLTTTARALVVRHTIVRSSTGHPEHRYVVRTRARIGKQEIDLEVTLVPRPLLLCRMLLGRRALAGRFVVDCGHKYLLTRARRLEKHRPGR